MRIGIDCRIYSSNFTGIGRYTHELVQNLIKINDEKKRPHEFILFFNNPEYKNYEPPNPSVKKVLVDAQHYSMKEQIKFLFILRKQKLDFTHFPHFNLPIFYRRPYMVTIHDLTLSLFPGRKMNKWYHRFAYNIVIKNAVKHAVKIIAVSNNTKEDIINHLNVPEEKIEVIYHGISEKFTLLDDPKITEKTLKKFQIEKDFLLYTGVWRDHKNLPRLIKAFSILKNEKYLDLSLVITGKPDPCYPEVKDTVKKLNLQQDVIFTGQVSDEELVHLYNAARIYVFPSLYEGFGFPPLEAMKCGTPVAASKASSIPEICGENNAIFFDPYDINDMADKIAMLYKDADMQTKLIENGIARACKFSWDITAEKTYDTIIKAHIKAT